MRPVIIAHRGASGHLPEHTLPAKALAYAMGADYLEQDIVASRDDRLLVLHDIHLDEVTNVASLFPDRHRPDGRFYARDFDLAEIRQLQAHERRDENGELVFPQRFDACGEEFRVHTLDEELRFVADLQVSGGRAVGIYPEIKQPAWHLREGIDLTVAVLEELERFDYVGHTDPVYLQCFDEGELRRVRHELGCELKLVQLIGEDNWDADETRYAELLTADGLRQLADTVDGIGPWLPQLYRSGPLRDAGLVACAHEQGLVVHPYTFRADALPPGFDRFDELLEFAIDELSIDGLFTDHPGHVQKFLRRISANAPSNS